MKFMRKNGGFTLVELIVVIAILAILAGVAVPAYSGYIAKAEQASALQILSAVNTAAQGLAIGENLRVTKIEVTSAGVITVYTVAADAAADAVGAAGTITEAKVEQLTGPVGALKGFSDKAVWSGSEWELDPIG